MQKKEMIQMVAVITVIIIAFYALQAFIFPSAPPPANTGKSNEAPANNTPADNTSPANAPTNAPADNKPVPPGELRSAGPAAGLTTTPTLAEAKYGFSRVERENATTYTLANSRMTARISDRGAVLESLKFVNAAGETVYWQTPDDPTIPPREALELLKPLEYAPDLAPLALQLDANDDLRNTSLWQLDVNETGDPSEGQALTFRFPPAGAEYGRESDDTVIYKTIKLLPDTYRLDVTVRIENHSDKVREKIVGLWGAVGITNDGMHAAGEHTRVALYGSTDSKRFNDLEDSPAVPAIGSAVRSRNEELAEEGLPTHDWITNRDLDEIEKNDRFLIAHGLRTQYFLAFLAADPDVRDTGWSGAILPLGNGGHDAAISLVAPALKVPAATASGPGSATTSMRLYTGPRDKDSLHEAWLAAPPQDPDLGPGQWTELATSGFFDLIASPLVWFLRILTGLVGPGFAIILLTLFVRFALSPLSYRGQKSMATYTQKMKVVKPKLDAIKEKYKGKGDRDAQMRMLNETRAAMKEQNVGMLPLGGCLPMLIQLPIFIGLYRAFGVAFFLRQAEFLWIHDLSLPDATLPVSTYVGDMFLVNFIAHNGYLTFNILPMLWIVLSIVQFRMQPKPDDPQQAAMQKQMGFIFPIMGLMFYGFASGFSFYFIVSSLYSIAESRLIKRNLIKQGVMPPPKPKIAVKDGDKPDYHGSK